MINGLIRMATGKYVMLLGDGDLPCDSLIQDVVIGCGSNRDVVLFGAENVNGEQYNFSVASKKYRQKNGIDNVLNPVYFHAIKKNLIQSVLLQPGSETSAFVQYSNRMRRISFSEYNNKNILIKSKNI